MKAHVKRIKELNALITAKAAEAESLLSGESKDVNKAASLLDEVDELEKEKKLEERLLSRAQQEAAEETEKSTPVTSNADNVTKEFADAFRAGFPFTAADKRKAMNEGTPEDGGYTVPEDIRTAVEKYRDAKFSLRQLVRVEHVTTKSGARTFQKRTEQTGFTEIAEGGKVQKKSAPKFERMEYNIKKYGGYMAVTNELLADSDANIRRTITEWLGDEARVTDNRLILEKIAEKEQVELNGYDGIKHTVNVELGQAFKDTCAIITNDDGLQWLDTLRDNNDRYLLTPDPSDTMQMRLSIGGKMVPVHVVPNCDRTSENIYEVSEDTTVKSGKTYYTRTGDGSNTAYTYTAVSEPTGNPKTSSYYEITGLKIPITIGDLNEGIELFDRQVLQLKQSDTAVVGSGGDQINGFEDDVTLIRGMMREDVQIRDAGAFVNGCIIV